MCYDFIKVIIYIYLSKYIKLYLNNNLKRLYNLINFSEKIIIQFIISIYSITYLLFITRIYYLFVFFFVLGI